MSDAEPWTIGRLLSWTAEYLAGRDADAPRLDAELLLAEVLGCARIDLYARFGEEPAEEDRGRFRDLVRRRAAGEPTAYLLGRKEFFSLEFRVTPDVLIPRPETELLVTATLDHLKASNESNPVLADVGTGSGAIAVAAAKYAPTAKVQAFDASGAALAVARENAERHGVTERIEFFESDLLGAAAEGSGFAVVAANLPYVGDDEVGSLSVSVRDYEPRSALVAGPRGDELIARLAPQAATRLRSGGLLLLELSPRLAGPVLEMLAGNAAWEEARVIRDMAGQERVVAAERK